MNFNKIIFTGALALAVITNGLFAQVKKPTPSAKSKPVAPAQQIKSAALPVDPNVIVGKLPNGLTYYIRSNSSPKNKALLFLVNKVGSTQETDAQQGMAHFVQRMVFDGTKDFSKNDLVNYMSKSGVKFNPDANGNTNYDETAFQMIVPTDTAKEFQKGFNILASLAGNATFDQAEADRERALLLQDVQQQSKGQQQRLEQQTYPVLLNNSRYAQRMPAGKEEVIKAFTAAAAKSFYHDWYRPDLQAVIAIGDFDAKRAEQLIKDYFSPLKNPVPEKPKVQYAVPPTLGTAVKFATDKGLNYTAVQIVVKHPQLVVKASSDMLQDIRINLFNQMLGARISDVTQQRNQPFVYGQANYGSFVGRQDAFSSIIQIKPGGLEAGIKAISAETERTKKFGFTLTELERAKQNALAQMGNLYAARGQANSSGFLAQYIQNFVNGSAMPGIEFEYNFYVNNIGKITLADINALAARLISDQNRVIIVAAPDAEKDKLPSEKILLQWVAEAGKNLTPYNDDVNTEPLLGALPTGSKVVSQQEDTIINVTRLTLKNGVKVILKPTQFSGGQILISGYSFGGTSLASDNDYTSANMVAGVIGNSGVAKFDQAQLNIKLRGKQVNISPYISETVQGISGNTNPANFETAMQLLYLYFTQPRKDAETWQSTVAQAKSALNGRGNDPASVYQDTVNAILNNHNPRGLPATMEQLNAASLDKAYDFYKARFADASGFTFTFVGSFTNNEIIPYIEAYLGALPADNHKETYKNLGLRPLAGQISRTVYKGTSDKATVQLIYNGSYDYNDANNIQMDALEEVLNLRLVTRLPEKTSGAFSLSAGVNYLKIPEGRYKATISFLCAPADVDKLSGDVMDEIGKIKQNGADTTSIKRFVNEEARSIQNQLRQNYFWAGYLGSTSQYGENPDQIIPHIQNLNEVTPQSTKEAANKYLSGSNLVKLILLPEKEKK
jgi:zinc protease